MESKIKIGIDMAVCINCHCSEPLCTVDSLSIFYFLNCVLHIAYRETSHPALKCAFLQDSWDHFVFTNRFKFDLDIWCLHNFGIFCVLFLLARSTLAQFRPINFVQLNFKQMATPEEQRAHLHSVARTEWRSFNRWTCIHGKTEKCDIIRVTLMLRHIWKWRHGISKFFHQ